MDTTRTTFVVRYEDLAFADVTFYVMSEAKRWIKAQRAGKFYDPYTGAVHHYLSPESRLYWMTKAQTLRLFRVVTTETEVR
jgi:hypothetical protein